MGKKRKRVELPVFEVEFKTFKDIDDYLKRKLNRCQRIDKETYDLAKKSLLSKSRLRQYFTSQVELHNDKVETRIRSNGKPADVEIEMDNKTKLSKEDEAKPKEKKKRKSTISVKFLNETGDRNRLALNSKLISKLFHVERYCQYDVCLPWSSVAFDRGKIVISYVNCLKQIVRYEFLHGCFLPIYNKVMPYIERSCPPLRVSIKAGAIAEIINASTLINFIYKMTITPNSLECTLGVDIEPSDRLELLPGKSYGIKFMERNGVFEKTPYLKYLSQRHLREFKVYYVTETVNHASQSISKDESGFIFVLHKSEKGMIMIYENMVDDSRASIVFLIQSSMYKDGVKSISEFLQSNIENKRQLLAQRRIRFNSRAIISIDRLVHNDLHSWMFEVNCLQYRL